MKHALTALILFIGVFFGVSARADVRKDVYADDRAVTRADDEGLRRLISARSADQLNKRIDERHRLSHDRLVCESELRTAQIPVACFRYILQGEVEHKDEFAWLQQLCRDRARNSKDRKDLARAEAEGQVPVSCRELARERAADLRYADESEHPAELFDRLVSGKKHP